MRKLCFILALCMLFPLVITACNSEADSSDNGTTVEQNDTSAPENTTDVTTQDGDINDTTTSEDPIVPPSPPRVPKTLKILAIGNSFSSDAMQYLYGIAKSAGVETVVLGNMYIAGCSLDTHLQHAKANDGAYTYYKNDSGKWVSSAKVAFENALKDEAWDFITFQQTSKTCGIASSYASLADLVKIVDSKKTNPDAKFFWHMTWAYQQDSAHTSFPNYDRDQMKMYTMTVDAVKSCVLTIPEFDGLIPSGTSVQNARTSFVGDNLTRDGYHMDYTLGRYIVGLTYFAAITGCDISDIAYIPAADITAEVMAMAKSAVADAVASPYEVTKSTHTQGTWTPSDEVSNKTPVSPEDCFEFDKAIAAGVGINLDNYVILEYDYIENGYYNCPKGTNITYPKESAGTYKENICSAKIYSIDEIPVNSIIICDAGWQFRPELWISLSKKATVRPDITKELITVMSAEWWGENKYFAFNISSSPKTDISAYYASAASHIRIYIPKSDAK